MGTMPYWLMKTPEMVAMDHWFSLEDGEPDLVTRYNNAIAAMQSSVYVHDSDALNGKLPTSPSGAFTHFSGLGGDWLNLQKPLSGGKYWPHVPTVTILLWFKHGITLAAQKGLGWSNLAGAAGTVFESELEYMSKDENANPEATWLNGVLPITTCWVCTSPPGTGTVQVDAVRGPSSVQLVISTPWPATMRSRTFDAVNAEIDEFWTRIHGGSAVLGGGG